MKKKKLTPYYISLAILTLVIVLLIILFINVTYGKPGKAKGLPSLSLWKPVGEDANQLGMLSENDSAIEKVRQVESPSDIKTIESILKEYWLSFLLLLLIVILLITWVLIVFKIHNG